MPKSATATTGRLSRLRQAISMSDLTQSFRDAIEITRQIGARCIWIDSLCIIQDDPIDWQREAVTMTHVYGSA